MWDSPTIAIAVLVGAGALFGHLLLNIDGAARNIGCQNCYKLPLNTLFNHCLVPFGQLNTKPCCARASFRSLRPERRKTRITNASFALALRRVPK
jgi:hypothetical protein